MKLTPDQRRLIDRLAAVLEAYRGRYAELGGTRRFDAYLPRTARREARVRAARSAPPDEGCWLSVRSRSARRLRIRGAASGPKIHASTSKSAIRRVGSQPCSPGRTSHSASRKARWMWRAGLGKERRTRPGEPAALQPELGLALRDPVAGRKCQRNHVLVDAQREGAVLIEVLRLVHFEDPWRGVAGHEHAVDAAPLARRHGVRKLRAAGQLLVEPLHEGPAASALRPPRAQEPGGRLPRSRARHLEDARDDGPLELEGHRV